MGWLKKAVGKIHEITKYIDPIGHYSLDAAQQTSSALVNETSKGLVKLGEKIGVNTDLPAAGVALSQKDKDDFSNWFVNTGLTAGAMMGGAAGTAAKVGGAVNTAENLSNIGKAANAEGDPVAGGTTPTAAGTTPAADGTGTGSGSLPSAANIQTLADGSLLVLLADGASKIFPAGSSVSQDGSILDAAGNLLLQLAPLLASVATPYLNNLQSGGLLKEGQEMLKRGGSDISGIATPDLTKLIPELQLRVQQGLMTPAQAEAVLQEASLMAGVTSDQASLMGAKAKLAQLDEISQNQGLTEQDRAQLAATMNQATARQAQNRAAQIQQLQMQGNAGTGAELAARLSGVQGDANANFAAGADVAKSAQQRALDAMKAGLEGNTTLNQQLFNQDKAKAEAQDMVNKFNAEARNAMNKANMANQQEANLTNFNTAQDVNKANTEIANTQKMLGLSTAQKTFENNLDKQKAASNAQIAAGKALVDAGTAQITRSTNAGGTSTGTAGNVLNTVKNGATQVVNGLKYVYDAAKGLWSAENGAGPDLETLPNDPNSGIDPNVGNEIPTYTDTPDLPPFDFDEEDFTGADYEFSDSRLKTNKKQLSDDDVDQMMASMTGYKYRYKGPSTNPTQAGVMAQDVQTGMPNSVVNTPAGKMIQKAPTMSSALAVLANQHARIRKLEGKSYGK